MQSCVVRRSPIYSQIARRVYEPTSLIDIFPTIAELAGLVGVPPNDGTSVAPSFKDPGWRRQSPAIMTWGKRQSLHPARQMALYAI
jgi:arylsulfatase A-like enzyme